MSDRKENRKENRVPKPSGSIPVSSRSEWLSLGEASKYLGVHYTTLRTWSDSGDLAVFRTPGGHRRFRLADLRRFLSDRADSAVVSGDQELVEMAIGRTRKQIQQMPDGWRWLKEMDEDARNVRRERGRQLFALAISYVLKSGQRERILIDGRVLGFQYGAEAALGGVGLAETGQAVQFFRKQLVDAIQEGSETRGLDSEDVHVQRLIDRFIDEVLFAVLDGYEENVGVSVTEK